MAPATEADRFFAKVPKARAVDLAPLPVRTTRRQTPATGAGAIYGRWPGDETEEELLAALKEANQ
jgi:hypothetical protein